MDRKFVFPILKNAEIVVCMKELGANFTEEDLLRPATPRILAAYEIILDVLLGTTREDIANRFLRRQEDLEYSEIYTDSVPLLSFHNSFSILMRQVGITDYSLRDLQKPEPQRVRRILSACINLLKFREERMPIYDELTEKSDRLLERYQALAIQTDELSQKLEDLKAERERDAPQIKQIQEINNSLTRELIQLKKVQVDLSSRIDALKKTKNEYAQKFAESDATVTSIKSEISNVSKKIVHSPKKLQDSITAMGKALSQERAEFINLEKKARDLQSKAETLSVTEKQLQECLQQMTDCGADLQKLQEAQQRKKQVEDTMQQKLRDQHELQIKETQLRRQIEIASEKLDRIEQQRTVKREAAQGRMDQVQAEYEQISLERDRNIQEIESTKAYIAQTEQKVAELRQSMELEATSVQAEFLKLKAHVEKYVTDLSSAIEQEF